MVESVATERAHILLAPGRGSLASLVWMIGVARGAARLFDGVCDHRDDRVVRDPPLARTVVVENVTEPKPALLHELPRTDSFQVGMEKMKMKVSGQCNTAGFNPRPAARPVRPTIGSRATRR